MSQDKHHTKHILAVSLSVKTFLIWPLYRPQTCTVFLTETNWTLLTLSPGFYLLFALHYLVVVYSTQSKLYASQSVTKYLFDFSLSPNPALFPSLRVNWMVSSEQEMVTVTSLLPHHQLPRLAVFLPRAIDPPPALAPLMRAVAQYHTGRFSMLLWQSYWHFVVVDHFLTGLSFARLVSEKWALDN